MTVGPFTRIVAVKAAGQRLDAFLADQLSDFSRSRSAVLVRQGTIRVDGILRKPGYKVKPGETVTGMIPPVEDAGLVPEPLPLAILFEDRDLIVVDKPAGMVVHPAAGHATGTLVNALLHHCPDLPGIGGEKRPGIVHRLDKDTSGVMVVAKNDLAHQALSHQFKMRQTQKRYIALVWGSPADTEGCIELPVGRHAVHRKIMAVVSGGRHACTLWQVLERFAGASLLALDLKTGRTHQIRVHCQAMGHPIVGDSVYGRRCFSSPNNRSGGSHPLLAKAERQMLHATRLCFTHPRTEEMLIFEAPLPQDMAGLTRELRQAMSAPGKH